MLPYRDSRIVRISLIIFFVLLIGYAFYEAQGILYGPVIEVPTETIVVTDPYTVIRGKAERITELRLNGKAISVTESGEFEEPYLLAAGTNYLILEAHDARGRRAHETITVIYQAPHEALKLSPPASADHDHIEP
jgi:hypothetical protein